MYSRLWRTVAALLAGMAYATASDPENLFKWGEYDSLIQILAPPSDTGLTPDAASRTSVDSMRAARNQLMLGVAYYAVGRRAKSDAAFRHALRLEPEIELDKFYVSPEIFSRFTGIAGEGRAADPAKTEAASRAAAQRSVPPEEPSPRTARPSPQAIFPHGTSHAWIWWSAAGSAALLAAGGWYWFEIRDRPSDHTTVIDAR